MLLTATTFVVAATALCCPASAVVVELNPMPERPFPEPMFNENTLESDWLIPRFRRSVDYPLFFKGGSQEFHKRNDPDYVYDFANAMPSKRSLPSHDLMTIGESENMLDAHMPEKRMYILRDGIRPSKRSMAIGRAGMRPGKRGFASVFRGKRAQMYPESYIPLNRFFFFDE